ncbi:hypothetical protein [Halorubellus sp. PRR65]|uniref:hypothetical protein n=1 Tax=Halorubellus sp. PRR65 TaxID=3098148 RepID=UPI002B261E14|nr:hypothetical protein [Halorubellus sp. PRR65]
MSVSAPLDRRTVVLVVTVVVCVTPASAGTAAGGGATEHATSPTVVEDRASASAASLAPVDVRPPNESVERADDVYVRENGDAVLVYDDAEQAAAVGVKPTASGFVGVNLTEGLVHALVRDPDAGTANVTGTSELVLAPGSVGGEGEFRLPRPESLESLGGSFGLHVTRTEARGDLYFDASYRPANGSGPLSRIESARTSGEVVVDADTVRANGRVSAFAPGADGVVGERTYAVEERSTAGGASAYELAATEQFRVADARAGRWDSRANATATLDAQYQRVAAALGGNATVSVRSYEWADNGTVDDRVTVTYAVVYEGVDEAVTEAVTRSVLETDSVDASAETAAAVGDAIGAVDVDRVRVHLASDGQRVRRTWNVSLSNYDDLVQAGFALGIEHSDSETLTEELELARSKFDASRAANLTHSVTWEGDLTSVSESRVNATGEVRYRTENYEAYVDELDDRYIHPRTEISVGGGGVTDGEQVSVGFQYSLEREELLDRGLDVVVNAETPATVESERLERFLAAVNRASLERSRLDVAVDNGTVTLEGGAGFENATALRPVLADAFGRDVSALYAGLDEEAEDSRTYVRLDGAFGENATTAAVRRHEAVGENTTVHLPEDWDEEDETFPSLDRLDSGIYVGLSGYHRGDLVVESTTEPERTDTEDGGIPGFGVPTTVGTFALLAALSVRRNRRRRQ